MAGKLIVHGIDAFVVAPTDIYIDKAKVGSVKMKETIELPLENDGVLCIGKGFNKSGKLNVYADGVTEVQCKWNRLTGKYSLDVISEPQKATEIKEQKEAAYNKEHRIRCNVCGKIFCYTQKDLDDNVTNALVAGVAAMGQIGAAIGGSTLDMHVSRATADSATSRVKDYTKCPDCNSSDLTDITDEDCTKSVKAISAVEEIKQLKELLDMGILTQEEFDAKKKQLLGL